MGWRALDVSAADGVVISRVDPGVMLDELFKGHTDGEWRAMYAADWYD